MQPKKRFGNVSTGGVAEPPKACGRQTALAFRFDQLLCTGQITSYAELARLGRVTPARISQFMNLFSLASDLQEALLFLPRVVRGRDPLHLGNCSRSRRRSIGRNNGDCGRPCAGWLGAELTASPLRALT
jgi:hypothetical protein